MLFPLRDLPAGNHGSCIYHLGLDICFDECNCHDSLQACLIGGIDHSSDHGFHTMKRYV